MYDSQSFNRYSYVRNNPLKYIDPSGHWGLSIVKGAFKVLKSAVNAVKHTTEVVQKHWKEIASVAVAVSVTLASGGLASGVAGAMLTGALAGGAAGIVGAKLNGASWSQAFSAGVKGAVIGAVSAGAAFGVAEGTSAMMGVDSTTAHASSFFNGTGGYGTAAFKAVAHGVSRAAIARAQGQNARSAFISGFMSSGFAAPRSWGPIGGTMATAAVSGTVSQATGGKFANGAMTGAFIHLFNHMMQDPRLKGRGVPDSMGGNSSENYKEIAQKTSDFCYDASKVVYSNDNTDNPWMYTMSKTLKRVSKVLDTLHDLPSRKE
jgi:hypothetical protein